VKEQEPVKMVLIDQVAEVVKMPLVFLLHHREKFGWMKLSCVHVAMGPVNKKFKTKEYTD
jgi:hypothetical protein